MRAGLGWGRSPGLTDRNPVARKAERLAASPAGQINHYRVAVAIMQARGDGRHIGVGVCGINRASRCWPSEGCNVLCGRPIVNGH